MLSINSARLAEVGVALAEALDGIKRLDSCFYFIFTKCFLPVDIFGYNQKSKENARF
jgi:hypothetical protein